MRYPINSMEDLRVAYTLLRMLEARVGQDRKEVRVLKFWIREYANMPASDRRIVSTDPSVILFPLPEWISNRNEAEVYFDEYERIEMMPSAFDCTGQAFTSWCKIVERHGRFWAYHCVGWDV